VARASWSGPGGAKAEGVVVKMGKWCLLEALDIIGFGFEHRALEIAYIS